MSKAVSNVIDFTAYRGCAVPRPIREVEAYWNLLADGRLVPDRSQVDPRGFQGALPNSFLLERIAPGFARIRLTGRHLSDLMGLDMQGLPLTSLFLPEARPAIIEITSAVFEEPAVARLRMSSAGGIGRRPLDARLILLPLRDDQGDVTRAIGCLVAEGAIGRPPRRFSVDETQCQTLIGYGRRSPQVLHAPPTAGETARGTIMEFPSRSD
jgi:hypothetical protein